MRSRRRQRRALSWRRRSRPRDGGTTGGQLAPGSYFVRYTFTYPNGAESNLSPSSSVVSIAAGNIPRVILPSLPTGASGYNLYLSDPSAAVGSDRSYRTAITNPVVDLAAAAPFGGIAPPSSVVPTVVPTVDPTGGNPYGGKLLGGTYAVFYTFTFAGGVESRPSPSSAPFSISHGNIPKVTLPALVSGATGINLYLYDTTGGSGPAVRYAVGIAKTTYTLPYDAPVIGADRPVNPIATVAATVDPTAGGKTGGKLQPGTYYLFYTFNLSGWSLSRWRRIGPQPDLAAVHRGGREHPPGHLCRSCRRECCLSGRRASTSTCRIRPRIRTRPRSTPAGSGPPTTT